MDALFPARPPTPHVPAQTEQGRLVRLADIPLEDRLKAVELCLRDTSNLQESLSLLAAALDPGDASALITDE